MRYSTLFASSLLVTAVSAQNYLANDPVWAVHSVCGVPAPCIANDTYNYYTAGDSVILGITWTKVLRQGLYTLGWQSPNPPAPSCQGQYPYGPAYYGVQLIRQEGRQLRIWEDDTDQLLYDFDLVVGSTLPLSWNNWNTDITVLAVDSVLIGTEMRARYELANSWAQYLIEGVGTSHGLFEPVSNFFDCGYGLDCFGLGSDAYYPDAGGGSCWLIMGVEDVKATTARSVFPNPATDVITIGGVPTNAAVEVFDATGKLVLATRLQGGRMSIATLARGVHQLRLTDAKGVLAVRFTKE